MGMARVLVARELSTSQIIALRDDIKARLLAFAMQETGKTATELLVRDAMPYEDFTFNSNKWCNQTAQVNVTWTKDWSKELPKTKFASFYGFLNHADVAYILGTKYKIGSSGQSTKDIVMHGKMRAEEVAKCYHEAVMYKGADTIYVEHYQASGGALAQYGEELELLCFVCEPYGAEISKSSQ